MKNNIDVCESGKSELDQGISNLTKAVRAKFELGPSLVGNGRHTLTLKCPDCK